MAGRRLWADLPAIPLSRAAPSKHPLTRQARFPLRRAEVDNTSSPRGGDDSPTAAATAQSLTL